MMRRTSAITVALLVLGMLISACSPKPAPPAQESAPAPSTAPATEEFILIGGVGPLSQPGAVEAGKEMKWAMEQAVKDINAKGGVLGQNLKLVFYDTQNQPDVAASMAKKLVQEDKVVAVVGEYHSGAGLAQIPTYSQFGVPVVFSETWNDKITGGDPDDPQNFPVNPPTVFRIAPTGSYANDFLAGWMVEGLNARKVIHVYEATDYGLGMAKTLKEQMDKAGVQLVEVQVELNQPDYSPILSRLASEHGDAAVAFYDVTGESSYIIVQNGFEVGLTDEDTLCVTNQVAQDDKAFWRAVPDGVGCVFSLVGLTPGQYNDMARDLVRASEAALGKTPNVWVFESYDSVWLVADAIQRAGSTDSKAVTAALEQTSFVGAQGQYAFPYNSANPLPADQPSWMWHQWPDPAYQLMEYYKKGQTLAESAVIWPPARQTHGKAYVAPEP